MDTNNLKPEERAEIRLAGWLMSHGIPVYLNRATIAQKLSCDVFTVKGLRKRPDIVFYSGGYCVVEVKSGVGSKNTRDARKIVSYYKDCLDGRASYHIEGKRIYPRCFLVATFFSPEGHLFDDEVVFKRTERDKAAYQGRPQKEYNQTFSFIRQIWDEWKPIKNNEFSMGVLLSGILDGGSDEPCVFVQEFNTRIMKWLPPHRFYGIGRR